MIPAIFNIKQLVSIRISDTILSDYMLVTYSKLRIFETVSTFESIPILEQFDTKYKTFPVHVHVHVSVYIHVHMNMEVKKQEKGRHGNEDISKMFNPVFYITSDSALFSSYS